MSQEQDHSQSEAGGLKGALNKMSDMVGGAVGMASASTAGSHTTAGFVQNACIGDLYEIEAGRIAAERSRNDAVREFGRMMVEHHTTAMHQMKSALMSSEVRRDFPDLQPTGELDNRREGLLKHLQEAPADDFDKTWLDQQRLAHQETVALHKGYAEHGDNPQLRSVALGGLPMVERHLKTLQTLAFH
jgi:putative membrane protein